MVSSPIGVVSSLGRVVSSPNNVVIWGEFSKLRHSESRSEKPIDIELDVELDPDHGMPQDFL
jgi:hypothetical protein